MDIYAVAVCWYSIFGVYAIYAIVYVNTAECDSGRGICSNLLLLCSHTNTQKPNQAANAMMMDRAGDKYDYIHYTYHV